MCLQICGQHRFQPVVHCHYVCLSAVVIQVVVLRCAAGVHEHIAGRPLRHRLGQSNVAVDQMQITDIIQSA